MSLCDLDWTFDLTVVTLKFCLGNISESIKCRRFMRGRDIASTLYV